jgi:hypothetical protein
MSLQAKIAVLISAVLAGSADLGTLKQELTNYGPSFNFADGSGANQANKLWSDTRTINASSNEAIDLAGVLTDAFGAGVSFTKVRALLVKASAANVNDVLVGGAAANQFLSMFGDATDVVKVKPGGCMLLVAPDANGYAAAAGTADQLKIANSGAGTGVTYDILIIGS